MQKNRLEAFSDGVLAIIITIMVLEIKVPHSSEWAELFKLWPVFFSYVLSFIYVGIYWGNHHHILHTIRHVNAGIIWTNMVQLFTLSLIPVATAWMGENHFETNTIVVYAIVLEINALAFYLLQSCIVRSQQHNEKLQMALKKTKTKGILSQMAYISAIPIAYFFPWVSFLLFSAVAVAWIVPERNIERALTE